ncbi:MAG: DNA-directed RNA polymerase subunit beta' [Clostridia bacterium]|nr:DNA-directed RNA polymerase subunit beta' [Clostridia bacterium]
MDKNTFDSIQIGLASPELIEQWSHGEVTKAETINYRTLKAERDGLFCERIFGPTKDWECLCGKYKRVRFKGKVCEKCGVEVTTKKVRRERMGHIELAAPVSHIWYFKALPSRMGAMLDMSTRHLERVLYFARYVVIDPGMNTSLEEKQLLTDAEYKSAREKYGDDFKAGMGAEAIYELLRKIDLDKLSAQLREELAKASGPKKVKIIKRLEIVESFRKSGNRPEWMILKKIPVLPADIRPMVQLDGGRFAASDINELYRRVINRNNRLKHFQEMHAPEIIIRNEKRMLQEFVDALIDNGKRGKPVTGASNRPLKSLSEILRGKQGRFRQNLLGKRVDYSGRSVIVVGPELKIYQCGLPKEMALELFKPFVMKRLIETQKANSIRDAKKKADKAAPEVWDALEYVIKEHPVLLNRAPTLHRLSIQAFEPILVEGRAIKLHPLVCPAFNADFDGDQMPVHVPLSSEAQAEARFLMLSANNLLKPVSGKAVTVPSQDMVLGSYYLTIDHPGEIGEGRVFRDFNEVEMAYENKRLGMHAAIKVRVTKVIDGEEKSALIDATYGRLIFNQRIPQDLGYVDRSVDPFGLEINFPTTSKKLKEIVDLTIKYHGFAEAAKVLDEIKAMGYKYSTRGSLSISVYDMTIPPEKKGLLEEAAKQVDEINELFAWGELAEEERYKQVVDVWDKTTNAVTDALIANLDKYNSLNMIATSGARGSIKQMRQLAGMRGLMFATNGKTIEIPIKSNFREGLTMLEYFMGAKGSRKSLSDTALRTADSGYLTRRLVDVSQDVIVREEDCGATSGIVVSDIVAGQVVVEKLFERLVGRYTVNDVVNEETGELIVPANTMMDEDMANDIINAGIKQVEVRTILRCLAKRGVCAHCYGADLAHGTTVAIGEAVGVIAAQSIGEPGTQLTMRTFHTGGVAGSDITQGLPRVEELFEARRPKKTAVVTEYNGTAHIVSDKKLSKVIVKGATDANGVPAADEVVYEIPFGMRLCIEDGQELTRGQQLTEGFLNPADVLHMSGIDAVYDYIIREVQKVYRGEDVEINDKHVECIARQMTRKVEIEDAGDTDLLVGTKVDIVEFREANEAIERRIAEGEISLRKAEGAPLLLGITKAALMTESFLSAASFQETTRVLTEAAIAGKKDRLLGLKENVIIGKLIPAGTGLSKYRAIEIEDEGEAQAEMEAEPIIGSFSPDTDDVILPAESDVLVLSDVEN